MYMCMVYVFLFFTKKISIYFKQSLYVFYKTLAFLKFCGIIMSGVVIEVLYLTHYISGCSAGGSVFDWGQRAAGSSPVTPIEKRNRINAHYLSVYAVFCYFLATCFLLFKYSFNLS